MAAGPLELEAARAAVLGAARPLATEPVPLRDALGRRLAADVAAAEPVPAADNSAMDGFAVRAEDTGGVSPGEPAALTIAGESRAGHPAAAPLEAGTAIRISTGAVLPEGADAVARVEVTRSDGDRVLVEEALEPGRDIRRAGEDIRLGEAVLRAGTLLGPAELGVLASLAVPAPSCRRRPRVCVLTSGDELLEPDEPMRPGGVRNSNAHTVPALARQAGAEVEVGGPLPDDPPATRDAIARALGFDVVVVCGGVSVGEHDHVKGALAELGVRQSFWGVALRPGRPTWFGTRDRTLVFGLPGNPVSAMVTFILLARPALVALGGGEPTPSRATARLATGYEKQPGRAHALRCRLELDDDGWLATPTGPQGSHILTSMLGADCLAIVPAEAARLEAGARVEIELLGATRH
jgi:molybdopterin molybdotransferase